MLFDSLWHCRDGLGIGMTINNPTVSVAGSFETDGNGTVGYDVENESPREWRRVSELLWRVGTNQRQSSAERRGRMEKGMHAEGIIYANPWHVQ